MSRFLWRALCLLAVSEIGFELTAEADTLPTFAATSVMVQWNSTEFTWSISGPSFSFGYSTTDVSSPIFTLDAGGIYNTGVGLSVAGGVPGTIIIDGISQPATFVGEATADSGLFTVPLLSPGSSEMITVPGIATGGYSVNFPNAIAMISVNLPGEMTFTFVPSSNPGQTDMVALDFETVPEPASITLCCVGLIIVLVARGTTKKPLSRGALTSNGAAA